MLKTVDVYWPLPTNPIWQTFRHGLRYPPLPFCCVTWLCCMQLVKRRNGMLFLGKRRGMYQRIVCPLHGLILKYQYRKRPVRPVWVPHGTFKDVKTGGEIDLDYILNRKWAVFIWLNQVNIIIPQGDTHIFSLFLDTMRDQIKEWKEGTKDVETKKIKLVNLN